MRKFAIIVAGGSGKRMGSVVPKQFILLAGKPILMHTVENFRKFDPDLNIIVVLPESQVGRWKELCEEFSFTVEHQIAIGGSSRFESVKNV